MSIYGRQSAFSRPASSIQQRQLYTLPPGTAADIQQPNVSGFQPPSLADILAILQQWLTNALPPSSSPSQGSTPDYTDNNAIAQQVQQLANGDPQTQELLADAMNMSLNPSDPEFQQQEARISASWQGSPEDLQKVFKLMSIANLNNIEGALKNVSTNMVPFSPQAQETQQKIATLDQMRNDLIQQLQQPTPDYTDNNVIAQQLQQLTNGDPQMSQLMTQAMNLDPNSPEFQQAQARISALWQGNPADLQNALKLMNIASINNVEGSLKNTLSNLDPSSPEAQQLQQRIAVIEQTRNDLIQHLQQ